MPRDGAGRWGRPALGLALAALAVTPFLLHRSSPPPPPARPRPPLPLPLAGVTVILDPGHGGADSGATRHGDCEADLTYRTAVEVAADVRRAGGRVVFTVRSRALDADLARTEPPLQMPRDAVLASTGAPLRLRRDDTPRPLWQRAAVARALWDACSFRTGNRQALFFLSLHYDDFPESRVHGALVCVDRRMGSVPPFARLLAARLCADGLARHDIWHGLSGISARRLGVLDPRENPVPQRLLLEVATISNPADALRAADPAWRKAMAARITAALIAARRANKG